MSEEKTTRLGTGRFWVIDVEYRNQRGELVGVESLDRASATARTQPSEPGVTPSTTSTPLDEVHEGDALPPLAYDVTVDHRRARRARRPRLAADAPRPRLRGRAQRRPRHLPEHARPGGVASSATSPTGPGRPGGSGGCGFRMRKPGVPRRHDGDRGHRHDGRASTTPAAAGSSSTSRSRVGDEACTDRARPRRHPDHARRQPLGPPRRALAALSWRTRDGSRLHPRAGAAPRDGRRRVRAARGPRRRPRDGGRPGRLPREVLGAARRARPARHDAARGATAAAGCRCSTRWSSTPSSGARSRRRRTS